MGPFFYDKKHYPRWRDSKGLVHRSVMRKMLGGRIPRGMVVHHKDGDKGNFRRGNLRLMTRSAHARLHAARRRMFGW